MLFPHWNIEFNREIVVNARETMNEVANYYIYFSRHEAFKTYTYKVWKLRNILYMLKK